MKIIQGFLFVFVVFVSIAMLSSVVWCVGEWLVGKVKRSYRDAINREQGIFEIDEPPTPWSEVFKEIDRGEYDDHDKAR